MTAALDRPRAGRALARLEAWPPVDPYGWRLLPFTLLLVVVAVVIDWFSEPNRPELLVAGVAVALLAQVLAGPGRRLGPMQIILPLTEMVAISLLDLGSSSAYDSVILLLFAPAVTLALVPGGRPLAVGILGVVAAAFAPVFLADDVLYPLLQATFSALVIVAVMLHVHAMGATLDKGRQLAAAYDLLRSIMDAATEQAIIATDETGRVVAVSRGAELLLQTPADQLVGTDIRDIASDAGAARLDQMADDVLEEGSHFYQRELVLGDARRFVEFVVTRRSPSDPDAGPLDGYLVVATDITAREEEQRQHEQFIGLVSHELRTPLVSILGYVDLLRLEQDQLSEDQREYVEVLARNASRLRRLVDTLLLSARMAAGDPMVREDVDVVQVVQAAIASVRPMADAAEVTVVPSGDPSVPLVSDPQRLGQVVDNLLTNAVKYSPAGGQVRVEVSGDSTADGARAARIRVADDGAGIAPEDLRRITEPFYRSRETRRRRIAGVGLGLTLVQSLVAEHGGTLRIESEYGRGTVVDVRLPDAPEQADPA